MILERSSFCSSAYSSSGSLCKYRVKTAMWQALVLFLDTQNIVSLHFLVNCTHHCICPINYLHCISLYSMQHSQLGLATLHAHAKNVRLCRLSQASMHYCMTSLPSGWSIGGATPARIVQHVTFDYPVICNNNYYLSMQMSLDSLMYH